VGRVWLEKLLSGRGSFVSGKKSKPKPRIGLAILGTKMLPKSATQSRESLLLSEAKGVRKKGGDHETQVGGPVVWMEMVSKEGNFGG